MDQQKEINIEACLKSPKYVTIRGEFVKFVDDEAALKFAIKGLKCYPDKEEVLKILDSNYPEEVSINIMESYMHKTINYDEMMKRYMDNFDECDQLKTLITTMNTINIRDALDDVEERVRTLHEIIQEWSPHTESGWNDPVFGDELHANVVLYDKYLVTKEHLNALDDKLGSIHECYPLWKIHDDWFYSDDGEGGEE
jgi:hypothetical protein